MTHGEEARISLIEETTEDDQTLWLCSLARRLDKIIPSTSLVIERVDGPAPLFFLLKFSDDTITLSNEYINHIVAKWEAHFDGKPPAPLIVLQPGVDLVPVDNENAS